MIWLNRLSRSIAKNACDKNCAPNHGNARSGGVSLSLFCWWSFDTTLSDIKRTSEMIKMSLPFDRVALDMMETLLTDGVARENFNVSELGSSFSNNNLRLFRKTTLSPPIVRICCSLSMSFKLNGCFCWITCFLKIFSVNSGTLNG